MVKISNYYICSLLKFIPTLVFFASTFGSTVAMAFEKTEYQPNLLRVLLVGEPGSECLGKPTTPICALDTYQACLNFGDADYCRAIGIEVDGSDRTGMPEDLGSNAAPAPAYKIKYIRIMEAEDEARLSRPLAWAKSGYAEIGLEINGECVRTNAALQCEWDHVDELWVHFKPVAGLWQLAGWIHYLGNAVCEYGHENKNCEYMILEDEMEVFINILK